MGEIYRRGGVFILMDAKFDKLVQFCDTKSNEVGVLRVDRKDEKWAK